MIQAGVTVSYSDNVKLSDAATSLEGMAAILRGWAKEYGDIPWWAFTVAKEMEWMVTRDNGKDLVVVVVG